LLSGEGSACRTEQSLWRSVRFLRPRRKSAARDPSSKPKELPMGLFSQDIKTMDDLFVHTLRDIYYTEQQIIIDQFII
jgi:hypothetical protein